MRGCFGIVFSLGGQPVHFCFSSFLVLEWKQLLLFQSRPKTKDPMVVPERAKAASGPALAPKPIESALQISTGIGNTTSSDCKLRTSTTKLGSGLDNLRFVVWQDIIPNHLDKSYDRPRPSQ
jgi:hypothetical protein